MWCPLRRATLSLAAGILLCTGCTADSGGHAARDVLRGDVRGPLAVPVDSVLLEETGRFYIGNPFSLVPDTTDGSFLISDFFEDRILRFGRDGRLLRTYGRPGPGPGEFQEIGAAFIVDDSIVVGVEDYRKLLQLFSAADGRYLRSHRFRGRVGMGTHSVTEAGVVFASRELVQLTSVAIWRYPHDEIDYVVPLPAEYVRSATHPRGAGPFAAFFSMGSAVAWTDTIMSGMSGVNDIFLSTWSGEAFDTLDPPAVRRRGVPDGMQELIEDPGYRGSLFDISSALRGLYRLSDGATAVVHHDAGLEGELPHGTITADTYLSVIDPGREAACVDALVPHFKEMRPIQTVVRDTVFLLDRRLNEAEDGLETWVRMYGIDTSQCTWLDLD